MNMLAHRHLPPTPQDAAIARVSGQALSRFAQARAPLTIRSNIECLADGVCTNKLPRWE